MSNSIWHKANEKPEDYETLLFEYYEWREPEVGSYQNELFVPYNDEFESLKSDEIEKWCYLDELLAQADKAERLQKTVVLIANMEQRLCIDDPVDILDDVLKIAKDEIKQLIKENK